MRNGHQPPKDWRVFRRMRHPGSPCRLSPAKVFPAEVTAEGGLVADQRFLRWKETGKELAHVTRYFHDGRDRGGLADAATNFS